MQAHSGFISFAARFLYTTLVLLIEMPALFNFWNIDYYAPQVEGEDATI